MEAPELQVGEPRRTYTVEPLEDPVPRELPAPPPAEEPHVEPVEPEEVPTE